MKSVFEHLSNELIYEIFEYLDLYDVYNGFFYLNKRFEYLLVGSNIPIKINIPPISKSNFEHYHKNIIISNKNRINILRLSNPFVIDIFFSPPRTISEFIQLETLILDNINTNSICQIFQELMSLINLHSLSLNIAQYFESSNELFAKLFLLPELKYGKIKYEIKTDYTPLSDCLIISPIEHLIINARFPYMSLYNLVNSLPKLRHLSINKLTHSSDDELKSCSVQLTPNLKYISFTLDVIMMAEFEKIIKNFFVHVEVLTLSSKYDESYLNANKWEDLISAYMPKLRIFDIKHDGNVTRSASTYHGLIKHFSSSYWKNKKWFFTHQHNWRESVNSGTFYTAEPYRRNNYSFNWQLNEQLCPYIKTMNLNTVKSIYICGLKANNNNYYYYFPNATELIIEQYFETFDDTLSEILSRIVPLNKIIKIIIKKFRLHFQQLIEILCYTCHLKVIETDHLRDDDIQPIAFQRSYNFRHASKTNKIKIFNLVHSCTEEKIKMVFKLFDKLEYLKLGMEKEESKKTIEFVLLNEFNKNSTLFFLCFTDVNFMWWKK